MNGRESSLRLKVLDTELSVCRLSDLAGVDLDGGLYFIGRTDQELSLVCPSDAVPGNSTFNTDYILVKKDKRDRAVEALTEAGYTVL